VLSGRTLTRVTGLAWCRAGRPGFGSLCTLGISSCPLFGRSQALSCDRVPGTPGRRAEMMVHADEIHIKI